MRINRIGWTVVLGMACGTGLLTSVAMSQDKPAATTAPSGGAGGASATPTPEQMMAAMIKYGTPGAEHERLKPLVGTFDAEVTMNMPGMPSQTSKGVSKNEMIFGGRYLRGDYSGDMMGVAFNGTQIFGYDKMKEKYVSSWIDSMSTAMMLSEGTADASGKVITVSCTYDCPITQGKRTSRQVLTIVDNDHHNFEAYDAGADGKEAMAMKIKYTRAK